MSFTYEYPRPTVTVDAVVLRALDLKKLQILLIQRGNNPFKGNWALPGGFLEMDENPLDGAGRELEEETCVKGLPLKPIFTCAEVGRDPRARCVTMVFGCLVADVAQQPKGSDDAAEAKWFSLFELPKMSFDHERVIQQVADNLKWQAQTSIIGQDVFEKEFSAENAKNLTNLICNNDSNNPINRGIQLGLISKEENEKYRFIPRKNSGPDWAPLVW